MAKVVQPSGPSINLNECAFAMKTNAEVASLAVIRQTRNYGGQQPPRLTRNNEQYNERTHHPHPAARPGARGATKHLLCHPHYVAAPLGSRSHHHRFHQHPGQPELASMAAAYHHFPSIYVNASVPFATSHAGRLDFAAAASTTTKLTTVNSTSTTVYTMNFDASTLELKRRSSPRHKLLMLPAVSTTFDADLRTFFYMALLVLIYCCVLIRASAAAAGNNAGGNETNAHADYHGLEANDAEVSAVVVVMPTAQLPKDGNVTKLANNTVRLFGTDPAVAAQLGTASSPPPATRYALTADSYLLHRLFKRDAAKVPDNNDDDSSYHDDEFDEYDALINNKSAKGKYIGAPCNELKCDSTLLHVTCDKETKTCGCEKNYPVQLGLTKGCDKPKKLGEQCFYDETCMFSDENSLCVQVRHNAMCQCASGFHSVSYTKPTRRVFCTQDLKELSSDLPTLLGVSTGIAVLAGLICMVLHLFSKTKYPRHRNFGDASLPPPIMYSSDTGLPLTVQSGRPSSRSSLRSTGSIGSYGNRRLSSSGAVAPGSSMGAGGGGSGGASGSKGILVSTSRTGSRRPSLASVHSTSSSVRSYSMMRFEKESQQKEIRQEMKLRLARLQQQQQLNQNKPQIIIGDGFIQHQQQQQQQLPHGTLNRITMATPSPLTPNSLDELLPAVDELQEYPPKPTTSAMCKAAKQTESVAAATLTAIKNAASGSNVSTTALAEAGEEVEAIVEQNAAAAGSSHIATAAAYIGPCSSSTEAL